MDEKMKIILAAENASKQAFDDYRRGIDGVVGSLGLLKTTAVAIAASTALNKLLDWSAQGAAAEKQAQAFDNLSTSVGANSSQILSDLKKVSRGFVSESDTIKAAGTAMMLGIPADKLSEMMKIAEATSRQTGQTVTQAFDDITRGVARESRLILDNLGIIVDVDKANENYARQLGKTAAALTEAERKQAFMNDVLRSGNDLVKKIGENKGSLDGMARASAEFKNLMDESSKVVATALNPALNKSADFMAMLSKSAKEFKDAITPAGTAIQKLTADQMREEIAAFDAMSGPQRSGAYTGQQISQIEAMRKYLKQLDADRIQSEAQRYGAGNIFQRMSESATAWERNEAMLEVGRYKNQRAGMNYEIDALYSMFEAREKDLKALEDAKKKEEERIRKIWEGWGVRPYTESEAFLADQKAFDDLKKYWSDYGQRGSQESEAVLADQKAFEDWKEKSKKDFNALVELSEHTAQRMQSNFSDLFFDAFTGKLKSLKDYAGAIFESIQRAAADVAGQMATQAIFGAKSVGGTQGGGGLIGWLKGLFGGGSGPEQLGQFSAKGNVFGPAGVERFAYGGVIDRPMVFPFRNGIGLAGEAGPEAIMPLRRNSRGELGVSGGVPSATINITVISPDGRMSRESLSQTGHAAYRGMKAAFARNA